MESRLFLVRHGQTYFNLEDRLGGDPELTQTGIDQAEKIALYLAQFKITIVYCSILKRSLRTAQIINANHDALLESLAELNEIKHGILDGASYAEFKQRFPELYQARKKDKYNFQFPNGESYKIATRRVTPFIAELRQKEGIFVVVGHQAINRIILGDLLEIDKQEIPHIETPNDVIFEIDLKDPNNTCYIRNNQRFQGYKITSST